MIHKAEHSIQLLHPINSQDPNIQFTVEEPGTYGSIPFLDTKVTPGPNNTIHTKVCRKPTHTYQYLHWDSNHFISAKNSVYNTPAHRELEHLRKALVACQFPNWAQNRLQQHFELKHSNNRDNNQTEGQPNNNNNRENNNKHNKNISMVIPYIPGLGEKFKRTCNKQGFQVHFEGTNTIKQLLMTPKDKNPKLAKSGVIYKYKCPTINCTEEYIGESGRTFGGQVQGKSQGTFTYTPSHFFHKTSSQP